MEVLKTNTRLKDGENQHAMSNLGCRFPRDLTPGMTNVTSKGEIDVARLIACKTQLSAEVIRWKTESLKLQKERDAARQKVKELDQSVSRLSEKAKELETQLVLSEQENIQLRTKSLIAENDYSHKLSRDPEKYHSFPWTEKYHSFPSDDGHNETIESDIPKREGVLEDWKEMSQRILEKMKQEMIELEELGNHFSMPQAPSKPIDEKKSSPASEEVEEIVSDLLCEVRTLKSYLLNQNHKFQHLFNSLLDTFQESNKSKIEINALRESDKSSTSKPKSQVNFSRPSDESFRDYFTKQLEGMHEVNKMTEAMQLFLRTEESHLKKNNELKQNTSQHSNAPSAETNPIEDRVCPICHVSFSENVSQKQFEDHVVDHLEAESASLLDQYVVL